ncbi:hypothetical protein NQ318_004424 [Aromia moschata]|uniref:Glutamyl-tRNA(Gln) amidotransferase subunit C, mitochondrial n=1 Tax=Aromia moschata TaxID=1265417 RepID=A0AAV8Y4T8_9CUCU|nr:hypothetical protein NQ318_004424 [Aromia moschata]
MNYLRHVNLLSRRFCTSKRCIKISQTDVKHVPQKAVASKIELHKPPPKTEIDADTIALLERLSLVDCANKEGIRILEASIEFADYILQVDTDDIESLFTVLEDIPLQVREDKVTEGDCREDILKNAVVTEEEYFVAPPGNIPLEARENPLHEEK